MKWILLLFCFLFLGGCQGKASYKEVFADASAVWNPGKTYTITIGVPQDAAEVKRENGSKTYCHEGGEYEIQTRVFYAKNADSAVNQLTGKRTDKLSIMQATRFSMPEYRFAWYDAAKRRLLQADLVMDETTCYAVVFAVDEKMGNKYNPLITEVFSTFGLHYDEGI